MATSINFKGIDQLTQKSTIAGTEKFPVSDTEYVTANQIASLGGGGGGGGTGSVTSVAMTVPTGLSVSGSPITTSGTLAVSLTSGYKIPTTSELSALAPLASPALTGVPTAPTAASGTNTTQIATTAFVSTAVSGKQDALVSGTNIKTINNESILGSGNITIQGGGGGDTSSCVHKTGDETVGGDKTFTDDIIVGDASNIKYGASSGSGFTRGYAVGTGGQATLQFSVSGEPKAFVVTSQDYGVGALVILGDSTGCRGVYAAASTYQHNYSTSFTASYSNGTLTITPPSGVTFIEEDYSIVYYYGSGTLTFKTSSVSPGSGVTSVTFTGTGLTETPAMYACLLETQVNSEQYRRVAAYTNASWWSDFKSLGLTFYSQQVVDTTSSFTVSYNNGLVINSGGTNAGGYFHNPGTYTLYYLMASDIGGGGGSYADLGAELSAMSSSISGKEAASNKVTSLSAQSTDTQYPSAKLLYDQLALKQGTITISSSEPTQYQGNNGDIWIVI